MSVVFYTRRTEKAAFGFEDVICHLHVTIT